ncbi:hypothetical protein Y1Q_0010426 [Alligator mississippiensis]|uniref:BLOC-1-related complex subunit 6 C-terminal helix domain-containing protein n=2 Tax=Alligator mississippiensis TaxID=8496 RepID=A0A151NH09_ALLMI|nr:hypothetical protein Y1Q_0010426 [Alligator mississippiensis]
MDLDTGSGFPPHVMAQVQIQPPEQGATEVTATAAGRLLDSRSLDGISQAYGPSRGPEGRRATISSALELEGTVSRDGDLTHFVANNLQLKIKLSSRGSLDEAEPPGPRARARAPDIPAVDPAVLRELEAAAGELALRVDRLLRGLSGAVQDMTALSVGYIQTYRDAVDGLGEAVDMGIKGMYTLLARGEELDRSMQPVHALAKQIRELKRTLEVFEALCK